MLSKSEQEALIIAVDIQLKEDFADVKDRLIAVAVIREIIEILFSDLKILRLDEMNVFVAENLLPVRDPKFSPCLHILANVLAIWNEKNGPKKDNS